MVRRCTGTMEEVTTLANLCRAFHRAARGKRHQPDVQAFEVDVWGRLSALGEAMREGRAPRNQFRKFQIRDPEASSHPRPGVRRPRGPPRLDGRRRADAG